MIGAKLKTNHMTDHATFWGWFVNVG